MLVSVVQDLKTGMDESQQVLQRVCLHRDSRSAPRTGSELASEVVKTPFKLAELAKPMLRKSLGSMHAEPLGPRFRKIREALYQVCLRVEDCPKWTVAPVQEVIWMTWR